MINHEVYKQLKKDTTIVKKQMREVISERWNGKKLLISEWQ